MCAFAKDIGIDLGTASVLVYVKNKKKLKTVTVYGRRKLHNGKNYHLNQ